MPRNSKPALGAKHLAAKLGKTQKQARRLLRTLPKYDDGMYTRYEFSNEEELEAVQQEIEQRNENEAQDTVVTSKGQLVIPARIRRRYQIEKGTRVQIQETSLGILLRPLTHQAIEQVRGILAHEDLPDRIEKEKDRDLT
jgi:AbrB family looped-hinge helix DNA binding protein